MKLAHFGLQLPDLKITNEEKENQLYIATQAVNHQER